MGSDLRFAELLEEHVARLDPANYVVTGSQNTSDSGESRREESTLHVSLLLLPLFSDVLSLPSSAYLDFPRSTEREAVVRRYSTLFTAGTTAGRFALVT